jgi:DNA-binding transcriptional ArsR family regulator
MGPLLNRLGIATYRHAMMLDLNELEKLTGIGKTKFKCLRDIRAEAFERALRAGATLIHLPPVAPTLTEWIEQSPWADWTPAQALGWLPTRVTGVIERFNLQTLAQLARWHANVKIDEVANYGGLVHRKVRQKLEALRDVGHEQLVFAGPQPQSIQALADRYLRTLKTERMRDVFKLRYIEGQTLEWIAERFGVTHERVRQIQANALRDDRPAWGPKAHALLKAGIARLKLRGGVARTAEVMAALAEPSSWAVHLALDLADLNEVLQIDVLPGISTTLSRDDFDALQRSLRAEVESGLKANLLRTVVEAAFAHHDLRLSPADVPVIAKSLLNVVMEGDRAWPQRRSTRAAYLGALRDAGGPTSAAELAEAVNTRAPALEATPRNVASTLRKTEQALHVGSGLWLHAAHCAKKFAQNVPK